MAEKPKVKDPHNFNMVGDYKVKDPLGEGVNGAVRLGVNVHNGMKVALKFINRTNMTEKQETRLKREIRFMSLLHHPNIVRLYDCFQFNNYYVFAMERVRKGELLKFITDHGYLSESKFRPMFRQIISAVYYCHQNSIVHRDLKPENILIDDNNNIKIIDFGLSNMFDGESYLTTFCGSPKYAAPEIITGTKYLGPSVDVWSIGVILFAAISGKLPFSGTIEATYAKVLSGVVNYPSHFSDSVKDLLSKFFILKPEDRITLEEAMNHPWTLEGFGSPPETHLSARPLTISAPDITIYEELYQYGYNDKEIKESLNDPGANPIKNTYFLLYEKANRENRFFQDSSSRERFSFTNLSSMLNHTLKSKKNKFDKDGFLLDLTYITENIIRMSNPGERATSVNPIREMGRFFEKYHKDSVKIYNLTSSKTSEYSAEKIGAVISRYPVHDSFVPPLKMTIKICEDMERYLGSSPKHVVAIHGKQDITRPAIVICCYLLHASIYKSAKEAINAFCDKMWPEEDKRHLFTPSMRRYVEYFQEAHENPDILSSIEFKIPHVHLNYVPDFDVYGGFDPIIKISLNVEKEEVKKIVKTVPLRHYNCKKDSYVSVICNPEKSVYDDICISVRDKDALTEEIMFEVFLNMNFIASNLKTVAKKKVEPKLDEEDDGFVMVKEESVSVGKKMEHSTLTLTKSQLDIDKKVLDKFPDNFEFTIHFLHESLTKQIILLDKHK